MRPESKLGRPKDKAKRDAILLAAQTLFRLHGFEAVTMDGIAVAAGVSKMTVYSHFHDKETLFEHFIISISDRMTKALGTPSAEERDLRKRLAAMGQVFLKTVFGPQSSGLLLSLPMVMQLKPSLGRRFYDAGPGRMRAALVSIINKHAKLGDLTVDRAEWAADDLIGLWAGGSAAKALFAIYPPRTQAEIIRRANRAVDVFLKIYAPASPVYHRSVARLR